MTVARRTGAGLGGTDMGKLDGRVAVIIGAGSAARERAGEMTRE
jgi:hypothetical protein